MIEGMMAQTPNEPETSLPDAAEEWALLTAWMGQVEQAVRALKHRAVVGTPAWGIFDVSIDAAHDLLNELRAAVFAPMPTPPDRYLVVWYPANESDAATLTMTLNRMDVAGWDVLHVHREAIGMQVVYRRKDES